MRIFSLTYYIQDPTFLAMAIHKHHQSSLALVSTFNPTSTVVAVTSNASGPAATKVSKTEKVKATLNVLGFQSKNSSVPKSELFHSPAEELVSVLDDFESNQQVTILGDEGGRFEDIEDEIIGDGNDGVVVYDLADLVDNPNPCKAASCGGCPANPLLGKLL